MHPPEYPETLRFNSCDNPVIPARSSVFTDIFKVTEGKKSAVAVKIFRVHAISNDRSNDLEEKFLKEGERWMSFRHENIAPVTIFKPPVDPNSPLLSFPRVVMNWYERGDIRNYIKFNPTANRLGLVIGIARGLDYLHDKGITHGSLYPPNILIDDEGKPVITDMEHSRIFTAEYYHVLSSPGGEKFRYSSREWITNSEDAAYMPASDVWSFGCTVIEVLTEVRPFASIASDVAVVLALHAQTKPFISNDLRMPNYVSKEYMDKLISCLDFKAEMRPSMKNFIQFMESRDLVSQ